MGLEHVLVCYIIVVGALWNLKGSEGIRFLIDREHFSPSMEDNNIQLEEHWQEGDPYLLIPPPPPPQPCLEYPPSPPSPLCIQDPPMFTPPPPQQPYLQNPPPPQQPYPQNPPPPQQPYLQNPPPPQQPYPQNPPPPQQPYPQNPPPPQQPYPQNPPPTPQQPYLQNPPPTPHTPRHHHHHQPVLYPDIPDWGYFTSIATFLATILGYFKFCWQVLEKCGLMMPQETKLITVVGPVTHQVTHHFAPSQQRHQHQHSHPTMPLSPTSSSTSSLDWGNLEGCSTWWNWCNPDN